MFWFLDPLKKVSKSQGLLAFVLVFLLAIFCQTQAAAEATLNLTALKLSRQVVQAGEEQEFSATLAVPSEWKQELPTAITVIFKDISDVKYIDLTLEVVLQLTESNASGATYRGWVGFPEKISRTKALTAISWRYSAAGKEVTQAVSGIRGAWFFVPIKSADPGYLAPTTTLQYTPVTGYLLRQPVAISKFSEVTTAIREDGSVWVSLLGSHIAADELTLVWTNGSYSETVYLQQHPHTPERWEGYFRPLGAHVGSYRLTRISDSATGERYRNYPDTYLTIARSRTSMPAVTLDSCLVSAIPYRLMGTAVINGETENISRVWFYWTYTSGDGRGHGAAISEAERSGNQWQSVYRPETGNSNAGTWCITRVRVDYHDGWQVVIEEPDEDNIYQALSNEIGVNSRPLDIPWYSRIHAAGDGQLLYFTFDTYDEEWVWGDIWLEFEMRSEAWVYDAVTRQIVVYHPFYDNGYYIRIHQQNESSVNNLFLYYPGDEPGVRKLR
ncbi:MAG: hypothetical protein FWF06_01900 [Symbiobacteriaceae bacterium]|nr:hypothetical protein [Symbiobacteriaceae bacterium]